MGSGDIASPFMTLALDGDELSASRPSRVIPYPLWRVGGPQNWSGVYAEKKNLFPLLRIEPRLLDRPAHNVFALPTELPRQMII
jgi:hypothetical protein